MAADTGRLLFEWDEWNGRPGFDKKFEKKISIITPESDITMLDNKIIKNLNIYTIEKLEAKLDEAGNVVLAGDRATFETGFIGVEEPKDEEPNKRVRAISKKKAVGNRKGTNKRKRN